MTMNAALKGSRSRTSSLEEKWIGSAKSSLRKWKNGKSKNRFSTRNKESVSSSGRRNFSSKSTLRSRQSSRKPRKRSCGWSKLEKGPARDLKIKLRVA